jgi:O-antigen ligase
VIEVLHPRPAKRALHGLWQRVDRLILRVIKPLVYCSAAFLFLSATATMDIGFTLRISYGLMALACVIGVMTVLQGWRKMPFIVILGATSVLSAYAISAAIGDDRALQGTTRGGEFRELVYLGDLVLGVAVVGLMVGAFRTEGQLRRVACALAVGAALGSGYAIYQWLAQQHGWPFSEVASTTDSNGITTGGLQGEGFLGRERVRGTFLEPHFLGAFLVSLLPITLALCGRTRGTGRALLIVTSGTLLFALLLTSSVPSWAVLTLTIAAGATLWAITKRTRASFAVATVALILAAALTAVSLETPERLSNVTGRSASQMRVTTDFRTTTWSRVVDIWSTRPVLGFGPGQSSVQLSTAGDYSGITRSDRPALQSAQGLWAASLVDAGLVGLGTWLLFLGGALALVFAKVLEAPMLIGSGFALAALAAVIGSQVSGDRLDLRVWLLLGLALAVTNNRRRETEHDAPGQETH